MQFDDAKNYVLKFGRYAGKTIDQAAESDRGLSWLDWMRGQMERGKGQRQYPETYLAICAYLDDETINRELLCVLRGER